MTGCGGAALVLITFANVLRTLVLPRGQRSGLVRVLFRCWRGALRALASVWRSYEALDAALAWLAPLVLISTLACWLATLFAGYGLLLQAFTGLGFLTALGEAGSSLFTLGFATTARPRLNAVDFFAAGTGPLVIALQIGYLPTLYATYNRREVEVALLQSQAAEPAWGPELLARQALAGTVDELGDLYRRWERLAADIGESHANYPILLSFRSPRPYRNWVLALLAVMDAAAMHLALSPTGQHVVPARLMLRAGFTGLRDIARVTNIAFDTDPEPEDPIQLTFEEYAQGVAHVQRAGFLTQRSTEESWSHFHGWRVNYEKIAYELARRTDAVPAPWSGGRHWPGKPMHPIRPIDRKPGIPEADRPPPETPTG